MVAIHGLGFARRTGGVMFAADLLGLDKVADLVAQMSEETTRVLPPAASLLERAEEGGSFSSQEPTGGDPAPLD